MPLSDAQWLMEARGGDAAPPADGAAKESGARPKSSATSRPPTPATEDRTDRLERILKSVLETQRRQQDRWEVDAQRQDQRWRSMEHQFLQLQRLVRGEEGSTQSVRQSLDELQQLNPSNARPASAQDVLLRMPPLDIQTPQPAVAQDPQAGLQSSLNSSSLGLSLTSRYQHGWKAPRMAPFEEDEDIEHYLTTFERLAAASQWPTESWVLHLVPLLKGKARAAYVAMSVDDSKDYIKVKQAVLDKFEINMETYRQRFRAKTILEGETAKELQARLKDLFEKWLTPKTKTKENVCEQIILEQFLDMLNPELQVWVRERTPQTSVEAAELVETFISARRSKRGYHLGPQEPWRRPQPAAHRDPEKTSLGKSVGGSGRVFRPSNSSNTTDGSNSPSGRHTPAAAPRIIICHGCGQHGHIKPECLVRKVTDSRLCYLPGPSNSSCTSSDVTVPVRVKGKTWQALVDSGSSQSFMLKSCLKMDNLQPVGEVIVRCIHGDETKHETVEVTIEINGQKYLLTVGLLEKCPYPVILGQDVPILTELLQGNVNMATAYVLTRAQAKLKSGQEVWSELPFAICSGGKARKTKAERRRAKVAGTALQESVPTPPLEVAVVEVADFGKMQREDPTLSSCFNAAKSPEEAREIVKEGDVCFFLRDGKLYRLTADKEQLVVPAALRAKVLYLGHSIPWSGHLGQEKTEQRILGRFYWPGFHNDITEYCRSCSQCQLTARSKRGLKAPLVSLPIIDVPFSRIAMDVVGPLEKSRAGHRYILVICDYATRYPEAFPLRHTKARQIANCLIQLFSRVGIPKEILTDQGTNFTSRKLRQVYSLLGIQGIRTTPYHPQTDGMVERFNQTLKSMLRKFVAESGADWDQWLPYLLFSYREVPQASTGFSPFELLFGREVRGPLDILRESWEGDAPHQSSNIVSYVLRMREKLDHLSSMAHNHLAQAHMRQKTWYDRTARSRTFSSGQKVLLLLPSSESSLLAKWQGPFEVLRRVGEVTYEIAMPDRRRQKQIYHVNLLKEWIGRPSAIQDQLWARTVEQEEELAEQYFPTAGAESTYPSVTHLTPEQQEELRRITPQGLFQDKPGRTNVITHDIRLTSPGPIRQTATRAPARLIPALKQEVQAMLDMGVIEPSHSEWCSPVVLVPKKDGGLRFCVDFSKLNGISAFDPYPMPRVDELVERLGKAKFLSTLDLCKGYWQVPLSPRAQELTAFRAPSGLFQFRTMPFGLHGAAATFQRLMDEVLRGAEEYAAAYIDDVVIHSASWTEHLQHLSDIFKRIRQAGLVVNASKCQLAKSEVCYLGYVLGSGTIRPQVSKVDAVRKCQPPSTKKGVRSFLGLVGWYRRFIPNFSSRAAPLSDLTRKTSPNKVVWSPECERAFLDLKDSMCNDPVLQSPDFSLPFTVQADASGIGLGAVLLQGEGEDKRPVQYVSRKLFPRETRYSTIEKECLAIKWALDTLKYYLVGKDFVLETDHRALQWLHRMRDFNSRITRWHLSLQPYRFTVRYKAGKDNVIADFLSRQDMVAPS